MPVLDENPKNGQKTLLTILGVMLAITVVIAVVASLAAP
ncbi:SGM_5486 family transporter-associated protein [Streptomyces sp. NPDC050610]